VTDRLPELADLDLRTVDPGLHDLARKRFAARDALGFVALTDNDRALRLVLDNLFALRAAGMYEQALLEALTGVRTNHHRWSLRILIPLLEAADRDRLRAAGGPLPGPGPFTLYRGVHGRGPARKVGGLHWTSSPSTAARFATRFAEWGDAHDPAVFVVRVAASAVLAYVTDRGEDDYLVGLLPDVRPRRLLTLPEPIRSGSAVIP